MQKVYEYTAITHRRAEKITVKECGQGLYVGINRLQDLPFNEVDEATESLVIPADQVGGFIEALKKIEGKY